MLTVIVDTSEQRPWTFPTDRFRTVRQDLPTGDYTLLGLEQSLTLERKSLGDFVGTVIHDWIRFRKQLVRMSAFDIAAIVVECSILDILDHKYESETPPSAILGKAHAIFLDHGIPVFFWGHKPIVDAEVAHFLTLVAAKQGVRDVVPRST